MGIYLLVHNAQIFLLILKYSILKAREEILKVYISKMSTIGINLKQMSDETENYTGADLKNLCKEVCAVLPLHFT